MKKSTKYIFIIIFLILVFIFGCPLYKLTGITCPTCGVTHSWIYFLKGEIGKAFKSNLFFIPLTILFARICYFEYKKKSFKKGELILHFIVALGAFIYNFYRIFF